MNKKATAHKKPGPKPAKPETTVERQRRVPMGGFRRKLSIAPDLKEQGFQYRWVNDVPGRLDDFKNAGYEFVTKEKVPVVGEDGVVIREGVDSRMSQMVGVNRDNSPMYAYLMRQRKEYYDEDQKAKEADIKAKESSILQGADAHGAPDRKDPSKPGRGQRYIPKSGISYERD